MVGKGAKSHIGVLLVVLGLGLAVWVSWPLVRFLPTAIPYTFSAKSNERVGGLVVGDHLQYLYHLHLLREAVEGRIPPFSNPYEFAGPYHLQAPYVYFPFAFLYAAFSYVSPAFGYNVLVLLSFVATMIAGYGLARAWGANRHGALCAGVVLTLFPHRLNSLFGGHAVGSAFFLFPMAWWGLEKNWQTGQKRWGLMAALSLIVMGVQDTHHLFFFCLLLPFWAFWKLLGEKAVEFPERTRGERLTMVSMVSWQAILAAVLLAASYHFHQARMMAVPLISPAFLGLLIFFSLAVLSLVWLMDVVLRWFGVEAGRFKRRWLSWPWLSFCVLIGHFAVDRVKSPLLASRLGLAWLLLASLLLFTLWHIAFLARAIQRKRLRAGKIHFPWRRIVKLWPAAAGVIIAVIYPLYLKVMVFARSGVAGGRTLLEVRLFSVPFKKLFIRTPEGGAYIGWAFLGLLLAGTISLFVLRKHRPLSEVRRRLGICLALTGLGTVLTCGVLLGHIFPLYNVLYRMVPFLSFIRSTAKYLVLSATGGAVALALLLTSFQARIRRGLARRWLTAGLAAALILDWGLISKVGVSVLPRRNSTYEVVKSQGKGTNLLELPIWPGGSAFSSPYQYGTMLTGVPTVNGYSPMIPAGYRENIGDPLYSLNVGILRQKEFDLLKSLNVRFINFHQEFFPRKVSPLPPTHSLKKLMLNPNLELVTREGGAHLFRLAGEAYKEAGEAALDATSSVSYYFPYDFLKHQIGKESHDSEAISGKAWSCRGKRGFVFFGPYILLPLGEYVAVFRLKLEAPHDVPNVGYLDVYSRELSEKKPLNPSDWPQPHAYRLVEIPFRVTQFYPLQTRGFLAGDRKAALWLDFVLIKKKGQGADIRLEAEDFYSGVGSLIKDKKATEGICMEIGGLPPAGQPILEEAFVFLTPGRYEVCCSARGKGGKMAMLRVRRVAATPQYNSFDVLGGKKEKDFIMSKGVLKVATPGVHGVSLWPAETALKAVDSISFYMESNL